MVILLEIKELRKLSTEDLVKKIKDTTYALNSPKRRRLKKSKNVIKIFITV